ncbi:MAG: phosphoribosylanthranilate isomerase [Deltaproteobacteria bacterium]|nr:phosphoribosylanthranilate isomerase [Deltaproteobacteria bacterium]
MPGPDLKICGLTRAEDVALCHELGVSYTGFVLAAQSPRYIAPAAVAAMPRGRAKRVGVFTDGAVSFVERAMEEGNLDLAQLHGGQDVEVCRALGPERVIKVFWPEKSGAETLQQELDRFAPFCAYFLFDAGNGGGGTGRTFAWEIVRGLRIPRPWFLAGGIGPDTVNDALAACAPYALDSSSGVEEAPGRKNAARLRQLAAMIRTLK